MRSVAAKEKSFHRSLIARPIEDRAHGEELVERKFAVENVPAGETVSRLQIERRDYVRRFDEFRQIWRMRGKRLNDSVRQLAAAFLPGSLLQLVGRELEVGGKHVLPLRREGRIENRGNRDVENRRGGDLAVLRGVEGLLQIVDFMADVNAAGKR